jgi:DNA-binding NtrC family response regulator
MATILIVDDEQSFLNAVSPIVGRSGHTILQATNAPDLAIVDMIMPDTGGLETIAEMRKLNPGIKVIAVSGAPKAGRSRLLDWATRMGASRAFAKPFVVQDFLDAVDALLREKAAEN